MAGKTIIAPASALGRGGVSVIRMSGDHSKQIAEAMCGSLAEPWKFKKCKIRSSEGQILDSGMVVFFESPNSYTGEDVVEFHCHGNPAIVNLILEDAVNRGARVAEPGEFTKTAFLNDKIDLAQAESVADLINAQSKSAIIAAGSSLSGEFSSKVDSIVEGLIKTRVVVEAHIDFPEEDIDSLLLEKISKDLLVFSSDIKSLLVDANNSMKLREGYRVAIVGPPNAGKSTLINTIAKESVAITSNIPGTTRDLVRAEVDLGGVIVEFVDTAGMRQNPENVIEEEGMLRSREAIEGSNLCLLIQDITEVQPFDIELENKMIVMNKCDLAVDELKEQQGAFYVSSLTGQGVGSLVKEVLLRLGVDEGSETPFLARKRHKVSIENSLHFLNVSIKDLEEKTGLELVAESLRLAHEELGGVLRPMSSDDLLGEIFSEFCIGK